MLVSHFRTFILFETLNEQYSDNVVIKSYIMNLHAQIVKRTVDEIMEEFRPYNLMKRTS